MNKLFFVAILTAILAFGFAGTAMADSQNLQLGCAGCVTGGSIITTQSLTAGQSLTITGNSTTNGELFLAIYIPNGTSGGNFNSSLGSSAEIWDMGVLSSVSDNDTGGNDHNYSSSVSMEALAGTGATAFNVFDVDTGVLLSCPMGSPCTTTFTLPAGTYPTGTIVVAFTEDGSGNIVADTPWSESIISTTSTPEPASLTLLGLGLLGVPFLRRKK